MSYQKQNFVSGQKLMASALNHIEDGIVAVEAGGSPLLMVRRAM